MEDEFVLKKQSGGAFLYVDGDGNHYQDVSSYVLGLFGFCGCGMPEAAIKIIYEALKNRAEDGPVKEEDIICHYVLDKECLTEHSSSVCSAWLTDKGERLLAFIEEHKTELGLAIDDDTIHPPKKKV